MARQDTMLESEGAEFLVLGQLLLHGIAAYKTYTNMPGYDVIAISAERGTSARVQVKSRWPTGAKGFPISNFDCDFLVFVRLNRGHRTRAAKSRAPEYFILPIEAVSNVYRPGKLGKVILADIEHAEEYREAWHLIGEHLRKGAAQPRAAADGAKRRT